MPFWKKGEDPWDLQPEAGAKPRMTSAQDTPTLFEELRDWNEARRERKTQRETPPPATACPWCGQDMETGWIAGGRDGIQWWSGWPPRSLVDETPIRVDLSLIHIYGVGHVVVLQRVGNRLFHH